jgi:PhnB protein
MPAAEGSDQPGRASLTAGSELALGGFQTVKQARDEPRLVVRYHKRSMPQAATPIPDGFHTITPHLTVDGAAAYIEFLKKAFGAVELYRSPGPGGRLLHASVRIGDSMLMLNDHFPEFGASPITPAPWPFALHLYVPNADATFDQAVAAGCTVTMPLANQFWGSRYGQVQDPTGFRWAIATQTEIVTPQEAEQRRAAMFGKA